jgi:hypothetical protein
MPATARRLGTTTEAVARMRPEEQLDYVERYLRPYAGRMRTQQDAYLVVLYPAAIGKPASQVLFTQGPRAYEQNKGLDRHQTGRITVGDTLAAVERHQQAPGSPAAATARDWGQVLFGTATPRQPVQASAAAPGAAAALAPPTDWGSVLFGTA